MVVFNKLLIKATRCFGTIPGPVGAIQYPTDPNANAQNASDGIKPFSKQNGASKGTKRRIIDYRHPDYNAMRNSWVIYRDAWIGGQDFTDKYTQVFSKREDPMDLAARKKYSYCPAISKGAVITIKNAIFQRMPEVSRTSGTQSYQIACNGDKWGVDKLGSSMNTFIGKEVMPEMLAMGRVGVFIDRPDMPDNFTMLDTINKRPYIYIFKCEDILAWVPDESHEPNQFKVLLLRENYLVTDPETNLPIAWQKRYRFLKTIQENNQNSHVEVSFYDSKGEQIDREGKTSSKKYELKMKVIPFVMFELSESLLTDVAAYQISLLNLASSDISYALKSNFPFYTEQYDPRSEPGPYKTGITPENKLNKDSAIVNQIRKSIKDDTAKEEIQVGVASGRRYPIGANPPAFIAPPTAPLEASMKKQEQLKQEIQQILSLWLSNVTAGSVDIKNQDMRQGLESGLHNIGMELEHGENRLSAIWAMYEGANTQATVHYPKSYSVKTDAERRQEAKELGLLKTDIPSMLFQKEISKQEATILFQGKIDQQKLLNIHTEIDKAQTMTCDPDAIASDYELGLVGGDLASQARGYPPGEYEQAKKDHAERLARIQASQTAEGSLKNPASRGVKDKATDPKADTTTEKKANATTETGEPDPTKQRGSGNGTGKEDTSGQNI